MRLTICIAAICDNGRRIVVAADRMYTAPAPVSLEFETDEGKIERLGKSCVALSSGNSAFATEILSAVADKMGGNPTPKLADVVDLIKVEYTSARARKAQETIVTPALGADFASFAAKGGMVPNYLQVQPGVYQQLVMQTLQYNLGLDVIVAGIDQSGADIAQVTHPGTTFNLNKLGYGAIGSGGIHAITKLYLDAQTKQRSTAETLYSVYQAKRASERAPGVGRTTDIGIIDNINGYAICDAETMAELERLVEAEPKVPRDLHELDKKLGSGEAGQ